MIDDNQRWGCLQLSPRHFSLAGVGWETQMNEIVNEMVKPALRLPNTVRVEPRLSKLLLYDAGGFSKSQHRDMGKSEAKGSFGTLMIVLPAAHSGGELIVRYAGQESTFSVARDGLYNIHCAAFFAGCEHEILPVRTGFLLTLVYDLVTQGSTSVPQPADNTQAVTTIQELMSAWSQDARGPRKLVIPLVHRYTERSLSFENLRGTDIAILDALLQAAACPESQHFHIDVGMLQTCLSRYQHETHPRMELIHMKGCGGELGCYLRIGVNTPELLPRSAPHHQLLDDEDAWNSSGTYGAAAIVWPFNRRWEVRSTSNPVAALAEACWLSRTVVALPRLLEDACLATGRFSPGEAQTVADLVLEHGQVHAVTELSCALKALAVHGADRLFGPSARSLVHLIIRHGDVELAKAFLQAYASQVLDRHLYQLGIVPPLGVKFGWKALGPLIVRAVLHAFALHFQCGFWLLLEIAPPQQEHKSQDAGTAEPRPVTCEIEKGLARGSKTSDGQVSCQPDSEREAMSRQAVEAFVAKVCGREAQTFLGLTHCPPMPDLREVRVIGLYLRVVERFGWDMMAPATEVIVRGLIFDSQSAADLLSTMIAAGIELERAAKREPGQDSLKRLVVVAERFHKHYAGK
ncbi:hypothetical protein KFL_001510120 [Klebsormidium nitens]|uniref:Fe2OG dioxygenase domain-containing protein n=1 Tax=Klebsormidium nitens TaxID=105231 RepID=A0A1Y1I247_KLENI|nr:hypothetical protein KFL_001510120 [Klebsormidium nitens]|eukprot:GAQ83509.1 hypothetical protein KFL_001510120 [Klebsormidium nitens]